jgi:hypothetical protein
MPKINIFRTFRGAAVIAIVATFGIGFTVGFYFVVLSHQETQTTGAPGYILAGFSGVGLTITLSGVLNTWANTPRLGYKNLYSKDNIHYLTYEKTKGKGMVEGCFGFLDTEPHTVVNSTATVWEDSGKKERDFGHPMGLRLFRVEGEESIYFPSAASLKEGFLENKMSYDEFIDRKLVVSVYAKKGGDPEIFSKKIRDIIYPSDGPSKRP